MPLKIVVYESEPAIAETFKRLTTDHHVFFVEALLSADNVTEHCDAQIISIDQSVLDASLISRFSQLQLIAVRSTGFDHIHLATCRKKRIAVSNVPGYAANAVAEHTFALLLSISRHVEAALHLTRKATFGWDGLQGMELAGKTMAVIGTGAIGRRVAEIACGFNMQVVAFDLYPDTKWADGRGIRYLDLESILGVADVISLNIPALSGKKHLLAAPEFAQMKKGMVIINTARGELIDSQAMVNALADGTVSAAGLDVLPDEHFIREKDKDPNIFFKNAFDTKTMLANHLLCHHPRVVITPHIGWFTVEAAQRSYDITVDNISAFLSDRPCNLVEG